MRIQRIKNLTTFCCYNKNKKKNSIECNENEWENRLEKVERFGLIKK